MCLDWGIKHIVTHSLWYNRCLDIMSAKERKANTKTIKYCQKLQKDFSGKTYGDCLDILMDGFVYDLSTQCQSRGDYTIIRLYKTADDPEISDTLIEEFKEPNSNCYDWKQADWNWDFIYKYLVDWMLKNRKNYAKKTRKSKKINTTKNTQTKNKKTS